MELPPTLLARTGFIFSDSEELVKAASPIESEEADEIRRLMSLGLPPVTSAAVLAVMMGYNPGFIHSMLVSPKAHYRLFLLPKGRGTRPIVAPKVALKGVQKWLSVRLQERFQPIDQVYGFVPGRSHIAAARRHVGAEWICSVDIQNFFPSVPQVRVEDAFAFLGYNAPKSLWLLTKLCCFKGTLVQGAPTSPLISNIVLRDLDTSLSQYANERDIEYTRYADDIVVSGKGKPPENVLQDLIQLVQQDGWNVSEHKSTISVSPSRLKVHGLLVHGPKIRLTKGYRNRIRAYRHLLKHGKIREEDINSVLGHINYSVQIDRND